MADENAILVLNAGSSSLKWTRFSGPQYSTARHDTVEIAGGDLQAALQSVLGRINGDDLIAVGHRVVHGGTKFTSPVSIDDAVFAELESLVPLAPLHQPQNLAAVRAARERFPNLPHVACFDTAFHRTQPAIAQKFGLPRRFTDKGVIRYGFHGLSYEYIASKLPQDSGRVIVAHLGNGASLCAMRDGKSVATTMSFTPADGLLMGTRCGSLDPGAVLYLMNHHGMTAEQVEHLINHESGLLGVSGISSDMRELMASDDPRAADAINLFVYRIGREIGSLAAALGGLDVLVFTGGIGENAPAIRDRIVNDARWLGDFAVHMIPTNEELMIAEHTHRVLGL
jgi:acetate kinase